MSDLIDAAESNSQVTGADDADLESCRSCGEPLAQPGIDGSCPKCLLVQPFAGMWDPREPPSAEEVAEALPRFRIERELGRGALGAVHRAIDTSLNRIVAIKAMVANPEVAMGTDMEPVPVTGFAANFSPMPRTAPPPFGREIVGACTR